MRTSSLVFTALLPLGLALGHGCVSDQSPSTEDGGDAAGDDDDGPDLTTTTGDTALDSGTFEPVAVGFEFVGATLPDGTTVDAVLDGTTWSPYVLLTFASADFFQTSDPDEQLEESCIALGFFYATAAVPDIPTKNPGAALLWSWDGILDLPADNHDCAGRVDPDVWGPNAEDLVHPFIGAHLGIGFGPMTDYLREQWSEETLLEYEPYMLAEYIAINDAEGNWLAEDWTTAFAYAWDRTTGEVTVDGDGYLEFVDVSGLTPTDPVPEVYWRSYAYWYQDFPLMDFDNLTDVAR